MALSEPFAVTQKRRAKAAREYPQLQFLDAGQLIRDDQDRLNRGALPSKFGQAAIRLAAAAAAQPTMPDTGDTALPDPTVDTPDVAPNVRGFDARRGLGPSMASVANQPTLDDYSPEVLEVRANSAIAQAETPWWAGAPRTLEQARAQAAGTEPPQLTDPAAAAALRGDVRGFAAEIAGALPDYARQAYTLSGAQAIAEPWYTGDNRIAQELTRPANYLIGAGAGGVLRNLGRNAAATGVGTAAYEALPEDANPLLKLGAGVLAGGAAYGAAGGVEQAVRGGLRALDDQAAREAMRAAAPETAQFGRGYLSEVTGAPRARVGVPEDVIPRQTVIMPNREVAAGMAGGANKKPLTEQQISALSAKAAAGKLTASDKARLMEELGRALGAETVEEQAARAPWNRADDTPVGEVGQQLASNLGRRLDLTRKGGEVERALGAARAADAADDPFARFDRPGVEYRPPSTLPPERMAAIRDRSRAAAEQRKAEAQLPGTVQLNQYRSALERVAEARVGTADRTVALQAATDIERTLPREDALTALREMRADLDSIAASQPAYVHQARTVIDTRIRALEMQRPPGFPLSGAGGGAPLPGEAGYVAPSREAMIHQSIMDYLDSELAPDVPAGTRAVAAEAKRTPLNRALRLLADIGNVPRTLQSSLDLSGSLRQMGFMAPSRRREWKAAMGAQVRSLTSEDSARRIEQEIADAPMAKYRKGTSLYQAAWDGSDIDQRDEQFMSAIASNLPVVKQTSRAYAVALNKYRADVFDNIVAKWAEADRTPERLEQLAKYVNAATGRGNLTGVLKDMAPAFNAIWFSPRFLASIPQRHLAAFTTDPLIRNEVLRDLGGFYGTGMTILGSLIAAKEAGLLPDDVSIEASDYNSPDWGKVKIGDSRVDIWGGHQQFARLVARMVDWSVNKAQGDETGPNPLDLTRQYLRYKFSPNANLEEQLRTGKTATGEEAPGAVETAIRLASPLLLQELYDAYDVGGIEAAAITVPSAFGIGVSTYEERSRRGGLPRPPQLPRPPRPVGAR